MAESENATGSATQPAIVNIRVGVLGAGGRMGLAVCEAVRGAPDLDLVAAVDPSHSGIDLHQLGVAGTGIQISGTAQALADAGAQVAVDFTELDAARENLRWCASNGVHAVVGTTGFTDADLSEIRSNAQKGGTGVFIAPNFAIGAVLMARLAEIAAPHFETVEIVEIHHDAKVDAPSGTAIHTAERIAAASGQWSEDPTTRTVIQGARGANGPGGIPIHSLRLRGPVAHQEVIFGTTGQSLSIRHDAYDRSCFMPGVLLAVRRVSEVAGLTIGLDAFL